ncbi:hypothetical protein [Aerosakkonema funiforme]|uniref:Uncharacterized protein n=1 Tax=Aerosakkonema funiforme FACHB-1375 TaxID=2949571 RepID=A0A926ZKH5_9CYAN|nr:hypothetical protein [Aerosakkonema funiforme]MBD2184011.1 hypothetical protein [Aerosakkonema funiforme FACHB-1375]
MNIITTKIPIANPGFELPFLGDNEFTVQDVPGWQVYDPSNLILIPFVSNYAVLNPATYSYLGEAPQGNNVGAIFLGLDPGSGEVALTQTLSSVLQPNTTYNLQVKVGNAAPDEFTPSGFPGYRVELLAGDRVIAQDNNTQSPLEGNFALSTVKYTSSANDPNLGKPLQIRLFNTLQGTGAEIGFDDVKLEATTPTVINGGFEDPVLADNDYTTQLVPGWQVYDPSNLISVPGVGNYAVLNPATYSYPQEAPEGNNVGAIFLGLPPGSGVVGLTQTLPTVLTADTTYQLKVKVGNAAPDEFTSPGFPGYAVQLLAGSQVIAQDNNTLNLPEGAFGESTVTYSAAANDPYLGQPLQIRLLNILQSEGAEIGFDDVRFDITKLPPKLFDEAYYLQNNPDVAQEVRAGRITSGLTHFNLSGRKEGRTLISPYFNEASYLQKYKDVADAVSAGVFSSGLQHFLDFGYEEGRAPDIGVPGSGDIYLRKYADVAAGVANGTFKSWYDHFLQFGLVEGRSPTYFYPTDYEGYYPDVAAAVADPNDNIVSAFDHFVRIGQYENRLPIFTGTSGNDVVQAFGLKPFLFGIDFQVTSFDPVDYISASTGLGEIDTLIGSPGAEVYQLGHGTSPSNPNGIQYYIGGGANDYAIIRNFEKGVDVIESIDPNLVQQVQNGNLRLFSRGDLVAVLEGVTTQLTRTNGGDFVFLPGTVFFT